MADSAVVATTSEGRVDGESAASSSASPSCVLSGSAFSCCAFFAVVFLAAAGLDVVFLVFVVPFDGVAADAAAPAAGDPVLRGVFRAVEDPDAPAFADAVFDAVVFDAVGFVSVAFDAAGLEAVVLAAAPFDAAVVDPEAFGVALLATAVLAAVVLAAAVFDAAVVLLAAAEVLVVFFAAGRDVEDAGSPCPAVAARSSTDAPPAPAVVARAAVPCVFRTGDFRAGAFLSAAFSAAGDAVPAVRAEAVPRAGAFFVGRAVVEPLADAVASRPEASSDGFTNASDAGVGLWSSDGFEGAEVTRRIYQDGAFSARHRMTSTS